MSSLMRPVGYREQDDAGVGWCAPEGSWEDNVETWGTRDTFCCAVNGSGFVGPTDRLFQMI